MDLSQNGRRIAGRLAGLAAALTLGSMASPFTPAFAGGPPEPRLVGAGTTGLNLTPSQQQKLTVLESASQAQSQQLIAQIQKLRRTLSDAYEAYTVDVGGVRKTNQELNRVQGQLLDLRLSQQMQLRKILSPDQFAQLQAAIHKNDAPDKGKRQERDERQERDDRQGHRHWETP